MAYLFWGLALKYLGKSKEALTPLRRGVACRPEELELQLALGRLDAVAEDLDKARAVQEQLAKDAPDVPDNHANLGRTYLLLGRLAKAQDQARQSGLWLEKAMNSLRRASERDPDNAVTLQALNDAEAEQKRLRR